VTLQSVWVLITRATYSTKYRRSGYAPGLSDKGKERKTKINKQTNTNYIQKGAPCSRSQLPKERHELSKHKNPIHLTVSTSLHPAGCQHDTNLCHRITTPRVRQGLLIPRKLSSIPLGLRGRWAEFVLLSNGRVPSILDS
jgi:hypothetical protein